MVKHSQADTAQPLEENEQLEPRSRPVQERSRQTVNRILETAAELVDEVGVVGFTTNLLAERANIRIRTIYRDFPNKLGILSALMIHLNEESEERAKQLSELDDPERDWRELVGTWVDDLLKWTRERPGARLPGPHYHGFLANCPPTNPKAPIVLRSPNTRYSRGRESVRGRL